MKPAYANLSPKTGTLTSGIYTVQFAPREWLAADPVIDFSTGVVLTTVSFISGRGWLSFNFTPDSPDYNDKPKLNRGGPYREISFSGVLNELTAATLQTLATIDGHQLVVVLWDKQQRRRLAGNRQVGLLATWEQRMQGSTETVSVTFSGEQEESPPFYTA